MNNKIKVSKFYEMNGLVEVRLKPECRFIDDKTPLFLYANSEETFTELWKKVSYIAWKGLRMGIDTTKDKCILSCGIYLNGILYTYDKKYGLWQTMFQNTGNDVPYLYAIGKYYRGATLR